MGKIISFQGEHGAFSEMAAYKHFGKKIETLPCKTFSEMFEKVKSGEADYAMVPVENSIAGDVSENWDLFLEKEVYAVGEEYQPVHLALIGHQGTGIKDVRKAYSHPQALAQSLEFLEKHNIEKIPEYDTAGAVEIIKKNGKIDEAALASELAAEIYGMKIIAKGIETNKNNTTRFLVASKHQIEKGNKMSLAFSTKHISGALYKCIEGIAENKLNLTKIASRPYKNRKWEYVFYIEISGNSNDAKTKAALYKLKKNSLFMKIIGTYEAAKDT